MPFTQHLAIIFFCFTTLAPWHYMIRFHFIKGVFCNTCWISVSINFLVAIWTLVPLSLVYFLCEFFIKCPDREMFFFSIYKVFVYTFNSSYIVIINQFLYFIFDISRCIFYQLSCAFTSLVLVIPNTPRKTFHFFAVLFKLTAYPFHN